jgi:predicted transcriptional regulator
MMAESLSGVKVVAKEKWLYSISEFANMVGKTRQGIHWLIKNKKIDIAEVCGRYKFISRQELVRYLTNK